MTTPQPPAGGISSPPIQTEIQSSSGAPPERESRKPKLPLAILGAVLGAAVGAAVWAAVEILTGYQIGYIAILVGALAGWGASLLGGGRSRTVGVIAATAGLAGVIAGSYASFYFQLHSDDTKQMARAQFEQGASTHAEWNQLAAEERNAIFEAAYEAEFLSSVTYMDIVKEEPKSFAIMLVFAAIGLFVGFKVGSG